MCEGYPISICRWVGVLRSRQPGKPSQTGKTSGDVPSSPFPPTRSRSGSASPRSGRLSRARRAPRERLRVALAVKESRSVEVKKNRTKVEVKGVVEGIKRTIFVWISVSVRRSNIRTSIQRSSPVATGQVGCRVPLDQFHAQPFRLCSICSHQPHNDIGTQHGCRVEPIHPFHHRPKKNSAFETMQISFTRSAESCFALSDVSGCARLCAPPFRGQRYVLQDSATLIQRSKTIPKMSQHGSYEGIRTWEELPNSNFIPAEDLQTRVTPDNMAWQSGACYHHEQKTIIQHHMCTRIFVGSQCYGLPGRHQLAPNPASTRHFYGQENTTHVLPSTKNGTGMINGPSISDAGEPKRSLLNTQNAQRSLLRTTETEPPNWLHVESKRIQN